MTKLNYAKLYAKKLEATGLFKTKIYEDLDGAPAVIIEWISMYVHDFTGLDVMTDIGWESLDIATNEWYPEKQNNELIRFYK